MSAGASSNLFACATGQRSEPGLRRRVGSDTFVISGVTPCARRIAGQNSGGTSPARLRKMVRAPIGSGLAASLSNWLKESVAGLVDRYFSTDVLDRV
jgi:hypothetical protein